jgi:hypothetical protein
VTMPFAMVAPGWPGVIGRSAAAWVFPGSTVDLDFVNGRYFAAASLVSFATAVSIDTATLTLGTGLSITGTSKPSLTGAAATLALAAKALYIETNAVTRTAGTERMFDVAGAQIALAALVNAVRVSPNNGAAFSEATFGSGTWTGLVKMSFGMDASGTTAKANGGATASNATAWGTPAGTFYLGNRAAGDRPLVGTIRRFTCGPTKGMFDGLTV